MLLMSSMSTLAVSSLMLSRYSALRDVVDASNFICSTYIYKYTPYMPGKYFPHITYVHNLVGIIVSGTFLAITWSICCGWLVLYIYGKYWICIFLKEFGFVSHICSVAAIYFHHYVSNMYSMLLVTLLMPLTSHWQIYVYISHIICRIFEYMAYKHTLEWIFFWNNMAITCEVVLFWYLYAKMLDLFVCSA